MTQETITFNLDTDKKKVLDRIASSMERERTDILNDAIDAYLEIYQWQLDHIQEGLRQADAGEFATEEEVAAAFARWRQ
ncbi:MAG: CopG family transcriptional regulator [Oscillatoria sp. SIO1A7]|nr:CopG family transcriptional regulator [Oscillatoria sp. SIO1A7]